MRFYNELAGQASVRVPHCFLAEIDQETTGAFVIVLEDLGDLRRADQLEGMSIAQATAAARALAELHGGFWRRVDHLDWVPSVVHERIQTFAGGLADALGRRSPDVSPIGCPTVRSPPASGSGTTTGA